MKNKINWLSDNFSLILLTLNYHNNDQLWSFLHIFLDMIYSNYYIIQNYVGTQTPISLKSTQQKLLVEIKEIDAITKNY